MANVYTIAITGFGSLLIWTYLKMSMKLVSQDSVSVNTNIL